MASPYFLLLLALSPLLLQPPLFFFLFTNFSMLPIQLRARKRDVTSSSQIILSFAAMLPHSLLDHTSILLFLYYGLQWLLVRCPSSLSAAILNSLVKGVTSLRAPPQLSSTSRPWIAAKDYSTSKGQKTQANAFLFCYMPPYVMLLEVLVLISNSTDLPIGFAFTTSMQMFRMYVHVTTNLSEVPLEN